MKEEAPHFPTAERTRLLVAPDVPRAAGTRQKTRQPHAPIVPETGGRRYLVSTRKPTGTATVLLERQGVIRGNVKRIATSASDVHGAVDRRGERIRLISAVRRRPVSPLSVEREIVECVSPSNVPLASSTNRRGSGACGRTCQFLHGEHPPPQSMASSVRRKGSRSHRRSRRSRSRSPRPGSATEASAIKMQFGSPQRQGSRGRQRAAGGACAVRGARARERPRKRVTGSARRPVRAFGEGWLRRVACKKRWQGRVDGGATTGARQRAAFARGRGEAGGGERGRAGWNDPRYKLASTPLGGASRDTRDS